MRHAWQLHVSWVQLVWLAWKNHCTHVKNWCKCQLVGERAEHHIGHAAAWKWENLEVAWWHHPNDPNGNICRSIVILSSTCLVPFASAWWASACTFRSYHHSELLWNYQSSSLFTSALQAIDLSSNVELPGSLAPLYRRVPKQSADCLRTVKLQRLTAKHCFVKACTSTTE
jgi:hypothetical protein